MASAVKIVKLQNKYKEMQEFIITCKSTDNDFNGNPMALCEIWTKGTDDYNGNLWYPKIKGYRERKDRNYKIYIHGGIDKTLDIFIDHLQDHLLFDR